MDEEQVIEQRIERLRGKLIDVLNDQRKKDQRTGKSIMDSNVCLLSALTLVAADVIVSAASREAVDGYRNAYVDELQKCIHKILQNKMQ